MWIQKAIWWESHLCDLCIVELVSLREPHESHAALTGFSMVWHFAAYINRTNLAEESGNTSYGFHWFMVTKYWILLKKCENCPLLSAPEWFRVPVWFRYIDNHGNQTSQGHAEDCPSFWSRNIEKGWPSLMWGDNSPAGKM